MTAETLDRVVQTVREAVDQHLRNREVFAWRFTLPVDIDDEAHLLLETQWRLDHPGLAPRQCHTYEIAISLVGPASRLTESGVAALENKLAARLSALAAAPPGTTIPWTMRCRHHQTKDFDTNRELI
ncbi:hypothetical protein [Nocardia panacis]|uniref:hypothetical protein n=1 Tax=Nocardia panacis TaxID=2340916 RepID=UPI001EF11B82|nr:hypothetical protein [Nocardia panacis]